MKYLALVSTAAIIVILLGSVRWEPSSAQEPTPPARFDSVRQESFQRLIDVANREGFVRVIARLDVEFRPEGGLGDAVRGVQRSKIKQAQNDLLRSVDLRRESEAKLFDYIPFLAFEASAAELEMLKHHPSVLGIEEDVIGEPALAESTTIVGAPAAWTSGYTGAGQTVAIVDSGVDRNHSFLAGRVISEACYSSNVAGSSTSVCPGGATSSTAENSGLHCPNSVSGCAHGTNVAGIAAGRGTSFSGVARDANIIAIQIFSRFDSTNACGSSAPCARYWTSDLIRGLERVRALSDSIDNIAAVNLSLQTGQQFASNCNAAHAATKAAIDNLRSVGIPTAICSGNYAFTNALTAPACISTSVSVGSVDDGSLGTVTNAVSSFSDSSPLLHLLAPGRWINSSIPDNAFQNYSGTSMAAPHVAGAFAVLRQRSPNASIERMVSVLSSTGQPITDTRNGIVKPRIRVDLAVTAIGKRGPFDFDGDGRADISVHRPSDNFWYLQRSTAGFTGFQWGIEGDRPAPADFDGDGKTDMAIFRPSEGVWYIVMSQTQTFEAFSWGVAGDLPVPADHNGDGRADLVVYRESDNTFYKSSPVGGLFEAVQFGIAGDKPLNGDFDGDGRADIAVFRPSNNNWYVLRSSGGFTAQQFGETGDIPVPADYDADGKTDPAVFRPSSGVWYRTRSTAGGYDSVSWGQTGDVPVAADYDGDGKTDAAVFRPSESVWYLNGSTVGFVAASFGQTGDLPTPSVFIY